MRDREHIYALINLERDRQNRKWVRPDGWQDSNYIKHAVLSEEVGEVAQECLRIDFGGKDEADLTDELIQVAAVAVAWLEMLL